MTLMVIYKVLSSEKRSWTVLSLLKWGPKKCFKQKRGQKSDKPSSKKVLYGENYTGIRYEHNIVYIFAFCSPVSKFCKLKKIIKTSCTENS